MAEETLSVGGEENVAIPSTPVVPEEEEEVIEDVEPVDEIVDDVDPSIEEGV